MLKSGFSQNKLDTSLAGSSSMSFLITKVIEFCFTCFITVLCLFLLLYFMPGDPFYAASMGLSSSATPDSHFLYFYEQFIDWVTKLLQGDFGWSFLFNRPVATILFPALKNSFFLVMIGLAVTLSCSYGLSILAALHRESFLSKIINAFTLLSISVPTFWLCILFLSLYLKAITFSAEAQILNSTFEINSLFAILIFALTHIGIFTHHFKTQLDSTLRENYIKTAKAKGARRLQILMNHATLPSLFPFLGMMSITLGQIFSGQLVIEIIFDYPGMGSLIMDSIMNNDIPLASSSVLMMILAALFASFLLTITEHFILPYHHLALEKNHAI